MKLIQANIWHGKLDHRVRDFFQAEEPDFICLQEVCDLRGPAGTSRFTTLSEIAESSDLHYTYMSPTYSFNFMNRRLDYGNAILSKYPITSSKTVFINGKYKKDFDTVQDGGNIRNLQQAEIKVQDTTLNLFNHHGYRVGGGTYNGNEITLASVKTIADIIKTVDGPLILCGDFNLEPSSPSLDQLNRELHNLTISHDIKRTTSSLCPFNAVLDYVFINEKVSEKIFKVSDALISDHLPLVFEFTL